jgi:hypothetical protein
MQPSKISPASPLLDQPASFIPPDSSDSVFLWGAPNEGFQLMNPPAASQNSSNRNVITEQAISPALLAHSTELTSRDDVVVMKAQSGGPVAVSIPSFSHIGLDDTSFVSNQQLVNDLSQGPTEGLTKIIYQAEVFSGQNDQIFESQFEPSYQWQLAKLRSELQLALQSNEELGRQIEEGKEREIALIDQLYGEIAQNTYQRALLEQGGMLVSEDQHGEEGLLMELQRTRSEMMDVQGRLAAREAELEELRGENEFAMKIQRDVGAPVVVQKANRQGMLSRGLLNSLRPCLLEKIKIVKKKFSKSSPKARIFKIECVMNEFLFEQFDGAKQRLDFLGRPSEEQILFHGTSIFNINKYFTVTRIVS